MLKIDNILNIYSSYSLLLSYLKHSDEEEVKEVLKDRRVKEILINSSENKYDFIYMVEDRDIPLVKKYLFDDEGIEILSKTTDLRDKLNGIITSSDDELCSTLFKSDLFCEIVLKYKSDLSYFYFAINSEAAYYFCDYIVRNNLDLYIILAFGDDNLLELLKNYNFTPEQLEILTKSNAICSNKKSFEYLISTGKIKSLNSFSYKNLVMIADCKIELPINLLSEFDFVKKLSSMISTRDYRYLIKMLEKIGDISAIEESRKKYVNKRLFNPELENGIFKEYDGFLKELEYDGSIRTIRETFKKYLNPFGYSEMDRIQDKAWFCSSKNKCDELEEYLRKETKLEIVNMVLDYHFEDLPYDVLINLNEMLNYQKNSNVTINEEHRKIYETFYNLDSMSIEEIIKFHAEMMKYDIKTMFYEDYKKTKKDQAEDIKKSILNEEKIKKYYSKDISDKYGVPVYYLDGDPFYALVKGVYDYNVNENSFLTTADVPSFSLTSNKNLHTFKDPRTDLNLVFSDFDPELIVHTYPSDSFSSYSINTELTTSVNKLYSKDELTKSNAYNEILVRARNKNREDDLNNRIENPKVLGIYAYDEIPEWMIETAKEKNLPIILINTRKYGPQNNIINFEVDKANHIRSDVNLWNYDYDNICLEDPDSVRREKLK